MHSARSIRVHGVVQGVGFRPFVFRLAREKGLSGWVRNGEGGVEIFLEGAEGPLESFLKELEGRAPPASHISAVEVERVDPAGCREFVIRESRRREHPSVRISPDLAICPECLREMSDPADPRYRYPYINCTNCGPRYTVLLGLPYDRASTTMREWPLDPYCAAQYHDPTDRRFHAQPVACPACGPHYELRCGAEIVEGDQAAIGRAADLLRAGGIVAVKGLGGYHLACDARSARAVSALRERKFRKEKPFAVMVPDLAAARVLVDLSGVAEEWLASPARPIVLAPARVRLPEIAPDNGDLGVMLPYTPLHHLLFAAGAPEVLVMTSANRSSEPIAYEDPEALEMLAAIADAFLIGQRPIARRVEDSVVRLGAFGPVILRRSRGYVPGAVASLPVKRPILAAGADLKNTVTLVVDGQAFVSQHIGDLEHYGAFEAFSRTIQDLVSMYEVRWEDLLVAYDGHPQYISTTYARGLPAAEQRPVQHHRAHVASVLAEREAWETRVAGVSFDGTGYGDDHAIWGGEIFTGSIAEGFERAVHLRYAALPGGDAAARHPVQAAAGFLAQLDPLPAIDRGPFRFPPLYRQSRQLVLKQVRTFPTTSMGRLFDTAAALSGFTRAVSFEGQAAMWLENLARAARPGQAYPFPLCGGELDFRPLLAALIHDRLRGRDLSHIARAFHRGVARGVCRAVMSLCEAHRLDTVVLSGGVFQNELLLEDVKFFLGRGRLQVWTNRAVPPNDGGISLGQAALAAFRM